MASRFGVLLLSGLVLEQSYAVQLGAHRTLREADTTNHSSIPDFVFGLFGKRNDRPAAYDDIFLRYMPKHEVVVCGCAKCGTSSLYEYIYNNEFGSSWEDEYGGTQPYIHEVTSNRWANKFKMVSDSVEQAKLMGSAFSFAIIRDPRERLLSAFKSKIACGCGDEQCDLATDINSRPLMVRELLKLAGLPRKTAQEGGKCMELDPFLNVIAKIHKDGNAKFLDRHFLPMGLGCFFEYPPEKWSKIVTLKRPRALADLAKRIGASSSEAPTAHSSAGKVLLTAESVALLDEITEPEYTLLDEYLEKEKSYLVERSYPMKPGIWALMRT